MLDNLTNSERVVAVIAAILGFAAIAEGSASAFILLVIMAMIFAYRNFGEASTGSQDNYEEEPQIVRRERPANTDQVHAHALRAVRNAKHDPNEVKVLPVDIGIISFSGENEPILHRTIPVDDDIDYIQPFVQLRIPVSAGGVIRFEIYDNTQQLLYVHEDQHQLERGRNLIIPNTRLPVHDEQEMDGRWELRIIADNVVIARHAFNWADSDASNFQRHLSNDGEITSELRAMMNSSRIEPMSLDDLLDYQEDDQAQQRGR